MKMFGVSTFVSVGVGALGLLIFYSGSFSNPIAIAATGGQRTNTSGGPCPDMTLASLGDLTPGLIAGHTKLGFSGLPCDAGQVPTAPTPVLRLQEGFDYFSWLTFLALNSPANGGQIGADAQPIWETWKQLPDVMEVGGAEPDPWDPHHNAGHPKACDAQFQPGMMVIRMDLEETYNEPFKSGPLFDQNGNYAVFVIYMNQAMFEYIVPPSERHNTSSQKSLYSIALQRHFKGPVNFPSGDKSGPGSVMVKASWKILTAKDDPSQYHTARAILYMPTRANPCQVVRVGLIGFHVGHKTKTRQQWVWTTFEHVRNVPTEKEVGDGTATGTYSFYSVADKGREPNQTPPGAWGPDETKWDPSHPSSFKSQIVRTGANSQAISDELRTINSAFQASLKGTVWSNYELILTQWPSDFGCSNRTPLDNPSLESLPDSTCAPFPTYLANSTLETFSQPVMKTGGVPLATSSCISCHNNATTHQIPARRSDFTFILEKAQ